MKPEEARRLLAEAVGDEDTIVLPSSVLNKLSSSDFPEDVRVQIGTQKGHTIHLEWEGRLYRKGDVLEAEAEYFRTRKYWYGPLGLEQYVDLVRRAVEARHRLRGDVEVVHFEDDGAFIQFFYIIKTGTDDPGKAWEVIAKVSSKVEEAAEKAANDVGREIAEIAARLSGWGAEPLDRLVEKVETSASTDDKGRSLEELTSKLLEQVPGFSITGRIRTATEEIDISVLNDSKEPRLRRESAIILTECKNWTGKCGKNEFVVFREKIENRNRRSTLGLLVSWNGFSETITKEMLRGSREDILIVPITGKEVRDAVRSGDFFTTLLGCWDRAVNL